MFRSQLLWRFYAGYVVIILISMLIVSVLVSRQVTENSVQEFRQSLAVRSELLAEIAKPSLSATDQQRAAGLLQTRIVQLGEDTQSRLTIIALDGSVIADSQELPLKMDNHGSRPEIIQARTDGSGFTSRYSQTLNQEMVYRAQRVTEHDELIGFVRVSLPLTTVDDKLAQLRLLVLFGAGVSALSALLLGFYFTKRFTDPLMNMTEIAEAISKGDFARRIAVRQPGEIGQLAATINRMARSSAERMAEITTDRNRLAMIFSGMVEGVIGVDQDRKIIHMNRAAARLLDLTINECLDKPIWEAVRVQEINQALENSIEVQQVVKTQMRRPTDTDDRVVDIYAGALRNTDGESTGAVVVLHDISELDKLERVRRDFVANASHELKTPITAIRGLTETILDDGAMEAATRERFTEKIHTQSLRLSSLVTDLMTISRLESGQNEQHFQPLNLVDVVRQSVSTAKTVCLEKQLTLTSEIPERTLQIDGDQQSISQLLDNLIDNAVKYTAPGGEIRVNLDRDDMSAILVVSDSGVGISPQHQQRIFERFYRIDKARSRELGGTGLGLSIVKNIAEQHGGTVLVESQPGVGTSFTIRLPLTV